LLHFFGSQRNRDIILKTVASVFPHCEGFRAYRNSLFILAAQEPLDLERKALDRRLRRQPALAQEARKAGVPDGQALLELRRFSAAEIRALAAREDLPLNTDDLPVVEYGMGKAEQLFRAKL
jgi:hypothetical protein